MKLTAPDLLALGVVDEIVPEPLGGAHREPEFVFRAVDEALSRHLSALGRLSSPAKHRYRKFRAMGTETGWKKEEP